MLTGAAAMTAPTAMAADNHVPSTTVQRASWGYVDEATPHRGHLDPPGDAPIGTWRGQAQNATEGTDGGHNGKHTARSYFTYDTARFAGARIISATLTTTETHAADCRKRAVQLWQTGPFDERSSWSRPPAEPHLLATRGIPAAGCLAVGEQFDVTAALTRSVAAGKALTLGMRVPSGKEDRAEFARRFANNPTLAVVYNTPPPTPTDMSVGLDPVPCGATAPGPLLVGALQDAAARFPADPDGPDDVMTARMAIWPADQPSERTEFTSIAIYDFVLFNLYPDRYELRDNVTYAMQYRAEDGTDVSPWTAPCFFTVDIVGPLVAPTVASPDYPDAHEPRGGVGIPGTFTFGANGDQDVIGYRYGYDDFANYVAADGPGGSATITYTPFASGYQWLQVVSVGSTGRWSPVTVHAFDVHETRPDVYSETYVYWMPSGGIGVPGDFRFTATVPGTVEFEYRMGDGPTRMVPAGPDGMAVITFAPERGGVHELSVRGRSAEGFGATRVYSFEVSTAPTVEIEPSPLVGRHSTVTPQAGMPGVVEFDYWFSLDESDLRTVPAAPDGSASFSWLPSWPAPYTLGVIGRTADGTESVVRWHNLNVDVATPEVAAAGGGAPGQEIAFTATTRMPEVTTYSYWTASDQSDLRTVPAAPDGSAAFTWTPEADGFYLVQVRATNATGAVTAVGATYVSIYSAPGVSSPDYPEWSPAGGVGVPGTFTFTPRQTDVVEYVYTLGTWTEPGPEVTVPAAPDGTASVVITPTVSGYQVLNVRSRDAAGRLSGLRQYTFIVG